MQVIKGKNKRKRESGSQSVKRIQGPESRQQRKQFIVLTLSFNNYQQ